MNPITTVAYQTDLTRKQTQQVSVWRQLHSGMWTVMIIAGTGLTAGCGKSDRELTTAERLKSVATAQDAPQDTAVVPRSGARDYMKELKDIRDNPKSEPAAIAAANRAIETGKSDPSKLAAAAAAVVPVAPPVTATTPAPTLITSPTLAPPVSATVATAPVTAPPPAAVPAPAPVPVAARPATGPTTEVRPVSREQPEFPREAAQRNIDEGTVRARATINANGEVTGVVILIANPARVFDRAVISAYKNWKFNTGTDGRTHEAEFGFKR